MFLQKIPSHLFSRKQKLCLRLQRHLRLSDLKHPGRQRCGHVMTQGLSMVAGSGREEIQYKMLNLTWIFHRNLGKNNLFHLKKGIQMQPVSSKIQVPSKFLVQVGIHTWESPICTVINTQKKSFMTSLQDFANLSSKPLRHWLLAARLVEKGSPSNSFTFQLITWRSISSSNVLSPLVPSIVGNVSYTKLRHVQM